MKTQKDIEKRIANINKRIENMNIDSKKGIGKKVDGKWFRDKYEYNGLLAERSILHWVLNGNKLEDEALKLHEVSQQRELLNGWEEYEQKWEYGEFEDRGDLIDEYLKTI